MSGPTALPLIEKLAGVSMRDVKFMRFKKITIAGHQVVALRQGMAGEIGFELQGPIALAQQIYERMGARVASINHLEACYPTIVMDYMPAIYDEDMAGYMAEFEKAMPGFAKTARVGGSFEGTKPSDYYRSPVELG